MVVVAGTASEAQDSTSELQLTDKTSKQQPVQLNTDLSDVGTQTDSSSAAPSHQQAKASGQSAQEEAEQDQPISTVHQEHNAAGADAAIAKHRSSNFKTNTDVESYDLAAKIPTAHHLRALSAGQPPGHLHTAVR